MADATHKCPGPSCLVDVPRHQLACRKHWAQVSPATKSEVYAAYRSGDSARHLIAMSDAIDEITERNTA